MTMQNEPGQDPGRSFASEQRTPEHPLIPASRVKGTRIFNTAGDHLGEVEDVAIDKVSGQVAYAIIGFGGFLGLGEHYHPLPWSLLSYDLDKGGYVVPLGKAELENAPKFDRSSLSGWDDADTRSAILEYYARYGMLPY